MSENQGYKIRKIGVKWDHLWILYLLRNSSLLGTEAVVHQRSSIKKNFFKNFAKFTVKHLCQSLFFNKVAGLHISIPPENVRKPSNVFRGYRNVQACNFIKKVILSQVFSCEFCQIFKNTYFYRSNLGAASVGVQTYG